jgi:hypothetical protein
VFETRGRKAALNALLARDLLTNAESASKSQLAQELRGGVLARLKHLLFGNEPEHEYELFFNRCSEQLQLNLVAQACDIALRKHPRIYNERWRKVDLLDKKRWEHPDRPLVNDLYTEKQMWAAGHSFELRNKGYTWTLSGPSLFMSAQGIFEEFVPELPEVGSPSSQYRGMDDPLVVDIVAMRVQASAINYRINARAHDGFESFRESMRSLERSVESRPLAAPGPPLTDELRDWAICLAWRVFRRGVPLDDAAGAIETEIAGLRRAMGRVA